MPINNIIKLRRGNATDWSAINSGDGPTLNAGEPGFEIDSNILKIGDGSTTWKDLKPIGADQSLYKVKNTSGGIIYKGQVVRANGTVGNSDAIQVTLFIADGSVPEYTIMGLATQDMNNNDFGYVTAFGQIRGIDTNPNNLSTNICAAGETWVDGDILYASPSASGKLTKNIPQHETIVAIVLNPADNGSLFVRPTWYPHLDDLHDVNTSGVANNDYLKYDSATSTWVPDSFEDNVMALLPSVSGSGYINSLFNNNIYTISVSGLQPSGNYSLVGHTHTSSNITDFDSSVSGLFPSVSGSGYVVTLFDSNAYTISVTGLQPSGNYSLEGHNHIISDISGLQTSLDSKQPSGTYASGIHTHLVSDIIDFNSEVSGLLPVKDIVGGSGILIEISSGIYTIAATGTSVSSTTSFSRGWFLS